MAILLSPPIQKLENDLKNYHLPFRSQSVTSGCHQPSCLAQLFTRFCIPTQLYPPLETFPCATPHRRCTAPPPHRCLFWRVDKENQPARKSAKQRRKRKKNKRRDSAKMNPQVGLMVWKHPHFTWSPASQKKTRQLFTVDSIRS